MTQCAPTQHNNKKHFFKEVGAYAHMNKRKKKEVGGGQE
jgi:hypothetical protein